MRYEEIDTTDHAMSFLFVDEEALAALGSGWHTTDREEWDVDGGRHYHLDEGTLPTWPDWATAVLEFDGVDDSKTMTRYLRSLHAKEDPHG